MNADKKKRTELSAYIGGLVRFFAFFQSPNQSVTTASFGRGFGCGRDQAID
jgi:hypothetical protein